MVKHVVFFRLKEQAEGNDKATNAAIIKERLLALRGIVPCLCSEEVGVNIPNAKNTDFDICLECTFDTWEDLNTYATHPEHLKVVDYIVRCKSARSAVDYEY